MSLFLRGATFCSERTSIHAAKPARIEPRFVKRSVRANGDVVLLVRRADTCEFFEVYRAAAGDTAAMHDIDTAQIAYQHPVTRDMFFELQATDQTLTP